MSSDQQAVELEARRRELRKLWRAWRPVHEMCQDRVCWACNPHLPLGLGIANVASHTEKQTHRKRNQDQLRSIPGLVYGRGWRCEVSSSLSRPRTAVRC